MEFAKTTRWGRLITIKDRSYPITEQIGNTDWQQFSNRSVYVTLDIQKDAKARVRLDVCKTSLCPQYFSLLIVPRRYFCSDSNCFMFCCSTFVLFAPYVW